MNPGIQFHEQILERILLAPNQWSGGANYSLFRHKDSRHAFTEAFGRPQACYACWCVDPVRSDFVLAEVKNEDDRHSRYLLKIVATWREWRKFAHPVRISINGFAVYDEALFLENTSTGWPGIYIDLPSHVLREGKNAIEIVSLSGEENTLLVAGVEILRRPDTVDFTVHSAPEAVASGEPFWVELHLLKEHGEILVQPTPGKIEFLGRDGTLFNFRATGEGIDIPIRFESGSLRCEAVIDKIGPARHPARVPVSVGLDGDDLRHDTAGEMDRALAHFIYSGVGNYVGFRTALGRNFCEEQRPTRACWKRWIEQGVKHRVYMHYSGPVENLAGLDFAAEVGDDYFSGYQFHEPYLAFQPLVAELLMTEEMKAAGNLLEKKEAYVNYLRGRILQEKRGPREVLSGEPALTCIYAAEAGVDGLLCEPVSNVSLLYGAARGTGKKFGAHIPGDWYFGYPHNNATVRRLELALWLAYCYGGQSLYIESSLFKTNAHDRKDWEDAYCRGVRQVLRDFYKFTQLDDRVGTPLVSLAFVYGHLESMFWMDDDRIPETFDMGDWDRLHFGAPGPTTHRRLWNASEAWLPRVPLDDSRNESLTRMFTGTPFGTVDIVIPTAELSRYRAVAFLGWNTMTEEIYQNLLAFVKGGGTLFLCGCHLDARIDLALPPSLVFGGKVDELIGAEIACPGEELLPGIRACVLKPTTATRLSEHFWVNDLGAGRVYFGNFYDYPSDFSLVAKITELLKGIGASVHAESSLQIKTSSPYVHYSVWEHEGRKKIYAVDAEWSKAEGAPEASLMIRERGQTVCVNVERGRITVIEPTSYAQI